MCSTPHATYQARNMELARVDAARNGARDVEEGMQIVVPRCPLRKLSSG